MEGVIHIKVEPEEDESGWSLADGTDEPGEQDSPLVAEGEQVPPTEDTEGHPLDLTVVKEEPPSPSSDANIRGNCDDHPDALERITEDTSNRTGTDHLGPASSHVNGGENLTVDLSHHPSSHGNSIGVQDPKSAASGNFRSYNHDALLQGLVSSIPAVGRRPNFSGIGQGHPDSKEIQQQDSTLLRSILSGGTVAIRAPAGGETNGYNPNTGAVPDSLNSSSGAILRTLLAPTTTTTVPPEPTAGNLVAPNPGIDPLSNGGDGNLLRSLLNPKPIAPKMQTAGGQMQNAVTTGGQGGVNPSNMGDLAFTQNLTLPQTFSRNMPVHVPTNSGAEPPEQSSSYSEDQAYKLLMEDLFNAQVREAMITRSLSGNPHTAQMPAAPLPEKSDTMAGSEAKVNSVEASPTDDSTDAVKTTLGSVMNRSGALVNIDDVVEMDWDNEQPGSSMPTVHSDGASHLPLVDEDHADQRDALVTGDLEDGPQELTIFADGTQAPPGLQCDRCSKVLKTRATLSKHKKDSCKYRDSTLTMPPKRVDFSCNVCAKTLKSEGALIKHRKKKCGAQKHDRHCQICQKRFPRGQAFKHHLLSHEEIERFPCAACEKLFLTRKRLAMHERVHAKEKIFHCSYCPKSFHAQANLNVHERLHTDERPFPCELCGKTFKRKRTLDGHIRSHTQEKPFGCSTCQKCFPTKTNLRTHQKIHSRSENFPCRHCDKTYVTKGGRDVHERVHTGIKPFHCLLCGNRYNHNRSLMDHMKRHSGEKPHRCSFCPKTFALKCNAHKHERVHTGEKPYKCTFCDRLFSQKNHANDHENTHTRKKTFQCEVCHKGFFQRASLYNHKIRHRDVKPFKCQYCEKTFINRLIVTNHERTHTGEKPFQCQYCTKAFNTKGYLTVHEKLHTTAMERHAIAAEQGLELTKTARLPRPPKEKIFRCQYCEKMFCTEKNARIHEERMHVVDRIPDPTENEFPIAYPEFDVANPLYSRSLLPLLRELQAKVINKTGPKESGTVQEDQGQSVSSSEECQAGLGETEESMLLRELQTNVVCQTGQKGGGTKQDDQELSVDPPEEYQAGLGETIEEMPLIRELEGKVIDQTAPQKSRTVQDDQELSFHPREECQAGLDQTEEMPLIGELQGKAINQTGPKGSGTVQDDQELPVDPREECRAGLDQTEEMP